MSVITRRLERATPVAFSVYAMFAAFSTYFCMYGLRKPFAVGVYEGPTVLGLELKTLFIMAQVLGYAGSKIIGVKVVSEVGAERRGLAIVVSAVAAELALVGFGLVPAPWSALFMVLNGLPLGMIWGFVFGYLEGRKVSDILGVGLCASFILASGVVKSVGRWLLTLGVSEAWMPATTGAVFLLPMLFFVAMLSQVPPPSAEDEAERSKRAPMDANARRAFVKQHWFGLFPLISAYVALTAYRDFRDNFARELWDAVGYGDAPAIYALSELPVAFGALVPVLLVGLYRDNHRALAFIHLVLGFGVSLVTVSTVAWKLGLIDPAVWLIACGLGTYLAYVPYNCVLFDRLVAALGSVATAAFLIQLADSMGYLGSVGLLVYKNLGQADLPWLAFFVNSGYALTALCLACWVISSNWLRGRAKAATIPSL